MAGGGRGGSVGFCERDALIMHVIEVMIRKTSILFDVDSSTLPFLVEES